MKKLMSLALVASIIVPSAPAYSSPARTLGRNVIRLINAYNRGGGIFLTTVSTTAGVYAVVVDCRNARIERSDTPLTPQQVNALIQQVCKRRG